MGTCSQWSHHPTREEIQTTPWPLHSFPLAFPHISVHLQGRFGLMARIEARETTYSTSNLLMSNFESCISFGHCPAISASWRYPPHPMNPMSADCLETRFHIPLGSVPRLGVNRMLCGPEKAWRSPLCGT